MATFIPSNIDDIENSTEKKMAQIMSKALKDDEIHIIHGLQTARKFKNGIILGESDFILISKTYGLLLIEVKGGDVHYNPHNPENQQWGYSPGATTPLKSSDPVKQCVKNWSTVLDFIRKQIPTFSQLYASGYAIALPDSNFKGELPIGLTEQMLFTHEKCQPDTIRDAIFTLFKSLKQKKEKETKVVHQLTDLDIQNIFTALTPVYQLIPILYKIFEEYERRIHALTEDQSSILDTLENQTKVAIAGVAGSGKTVLATTKAQSEAQKGKRVLFLCYNKALAEWLNSSVETGEIGEGYLQIDNYHHYVAQLCKDYERAWSSNAPNLWNEYAPNQLYDIASNFMSRENKYDTIIIDEGQDFHPNWWASIAPLFKSALNDQCYYVFYDPDQNIYQGQVVLPEGLNKPYPLKINCRNTKRISNYCAQIISNDMVVKKFAPDGTDPIFHYKSSLSTALTHAQNIAATKIAVEQQLTKKQVAILFIGAPATQINAIGSSLGFTTVHKKWRKNEGVLVSDAGAFKGLESDLVIVVDNDSHDTPEAISKRYVAFSRAKFELHIIKIQK
jgi:hypothetical protein